MFNQEEDHLATPAEACREYARNVGEQHRDRAWILTDWDTWERNPYYHGPAQPHPEFEDYITPEQTPVVVEVPNTPDEDIPF